MNETINSIEAIKSLGNEKETKQKMIDYKNENLKLTDREWICPHCGCHHDRDVNAARNLRFYGLWLLGYANQQTAASYAVAACPSCERLTEGSGSKPRPKDLRLQFFETQEQCRSLKQEITSTIRRCA